MIHNRYFLEILLESTKPLPLEDLSQRVVAKFGPNPIFTDCKGRAFDLECLLNHLQGKGKISVADGLVSPIRENICRHPRGVTSMGSGSRA